MYKILHKVVLKAQMFQKYLQCWEQMATYMTVQNGAISFALYHHEPSNSCIICSQWPNEKLKEDSWPLPHDAALALKEIEQQMQEAHFSVQAIADTEKFKWGENFLIEKETKQKFDQKKIILTPRNQILIFNDASCGVRSVYNLFHSLMQCISLTHQKILIVDGEYLKKVNWEEKTRLLIIPGGRARPYYSALGAQWKSEVVKRGEMRELKDIGEGNARIQKFIRTDGGCFLGICAGGYYGAAKTVFELGGKNEVIDEGALKLFEGTAEGPAYGLNKFEYYSEEGAEAARIKSEKLSVSLLPVYLNGGCYFHINQKPVPRHLVLAQYADIEDGKRTAIVEIPYGAGNAILSGVHFEYSSKTPTLTSAVKKELRSSDSERLLFFATVMNRLHIPLNDRFYSALMAKEEEL